MSENIVGHKSVQILLFIGTAGVQGAAVPLIIDKFFQTFSWQIEFIILIVIGITIYFLLKSIRTRIKKRNWQNIVIVTFCLFIVSIGILFFLTNKYISTTSDGFTYVKGTHYTEDAFNYKLLYNDTDNEMVESVHNEINLIWTNSHVIGRICFWILFSTCLLWDLFFMSYLNLKKFDKKKEPIK
jgi:hypothetical protein